MSKSIIADTYQLNKLLEKADETGIIAWQIGSIAFKVLNNGSFEKIRDKHYKDFSEYTKLELGKSEQTIKAYIEIYQAYENPDEVTSMLVTHLRELIKIKNKRFREIATKAFKKLSKNYILSEGSDKREQIYTLNEVKQVVTLIKSDTYINENEINEIVEEVYRVKKETDNKKFSNKIGLSLNSPFLPELNQLLEYEPRDEQGLVALFCLTFTHLKKFEFHLKVNERITRLTFDKIRFVRAKFPDASIICKDHGSFFDRLEIMVEFEFTSNRYWEHITSREPCHLIICWEDNINSKNISDRKLKLLPPIFSVKKFLIENKIEIIEK